MTVEQFAPSNVISSPEWIFIRINAISVAIKRSTSVLTWLGCRVRLAFRTIERDSYKTANHGVVWHRDYTMNTAIVQRRKYKSGSPVLYKCMAGVLALSSFLFPLCPSVTVWPLNLCGHVRPNCANSLNAPKSGPVRATMVPPVRSTAAITNP